MSICWITTVYDTPQSSFSGIPQTGATQAVSCSATSVQFGTAAITKWIRVYADSNVLIEFGDNPTATISSIPLAAGAAEYFEIEPGDLVAVKTQ